MGFFRVPDVLFQRGIFTYLALLATLRSALTMLVPFWQSKLLRRVITSTGMPNQSMEVMLKTYLRRPPVFRPWYIFSPDFYTAHLLTSLQNAFVERLGKQFNPTKMLVVDLLHEFELGVWKALFTHLIRLLYAAGQGSDVLVAELDARFVSRYLS